MIRAISIWLLCWTVANGQYLVEQPQDAKPEPPKVIGNLGQAIGEGAAVHVANLEARIAVLESLTTEYTPTWTWPGHNGPEPFEKLRKHMTGEAVHTPRDVSRWTNRELAFVHDRDHVEEHLREGKPLPTLKDQRLRDWLRAKNPAKALPKRLGWAIKRIVMHTQENCDPCKRWKQENLAAIQADGVEFIEAPPDGRNTPAFDVQYCDGDQCRTLLFGNMRYQTMKQAGSSL